MEPRWSYDLADRDAVDHGSLGDDFPARGTDHVHRLLPGRISHGRVRLEYGSHGGLSVPRTAHDVVVNAEQGLVVAIHHNLTDRRSNVAAMTMAVTEIGR